MPQPIKSLDQLMSGAALERFNIALANALANACDPNTSEKAKRKVTMTLIIVPNKDRRTASCSFDVRATLAPMSPIEQTVMISRDDAGSATAYEIGDQLPGQLDIDDVSSGIPNVIDFSKSKAT